MSSDKHTQGDLFVGTTDLHHNLVRVFQYVHSDGSARGICRLPFVDFKPNDFELTQEQAEKIAARIVECWNGWDMATDLLAEFVKMQNDPGYGDLVWRLAIKEKAESLLQNIKHKR